MFLIIDHKYTSEVDSVPNTSHTTLTTGASRKERPLVIDWRKSLCDVAKSAPAEANDVEGGSLKRQGSVLYK